MKKYLACAIALLLLVLCPINVMADKNDPKTETMIYLENGDYITVTLSESSTRATNTKSGSKTYTYYSSSGTTEWKAVLTGTFTYTGSSATCTASNCNVTLYNSAWYVVSKTASKSGNKATADVTIGQKWLGITVNKESVSILLTCSANGTLS